MRRIFASNKGLENATQMGKYKHENESTSNFEAAVPLQKNRANLSWDLFTFERRRWVAHSSFRIKTFS